MKAFSIILILFLTFHKSIKCDSMLDSGFDADFYGDLTEFSCEDNYCNIIDLIGPPPDMILDIPPPPIPSFLKGLNILNESENLDKCNHCNQFTDNSIGGLGFTLPKQSSNLFTLNSITISIGLAVISSFLLIAIYIKYKRMKISMSDTCAGFSSSFFFKNKDLQVNSRVDNCAPVVNEKTSQSIITNSPSKKSTIIPAKYWKTPTGNGINFVHPNNHLMVNEFNGCGLIDSTMTTEMGEYLQDEGGSCTSSPVYQSPIYADSNNHQINLENMSNLITLNSFNQLNSQPIRYKSYTMRNYSDIPNSIQINQLNQINPDTALLPDVSYDNEAYLPSSNSSDYHNKSLKKMMKSSKTPLLSTHSNVNHSLTLGYHLGNDKPKQTFIQHQLGTQLGNRMSINNTLMLGNHDQDQLNHQQPRYVQSGINKKNSLLIYNNGQPIISNTSTFQQKRPLPNIPNKQNFI